MVIAQLVDFCCIIYDKIVFENFDELDEAEIGKLKEIC